MNPPKDLTFLLVIVWQLHHLILVNPSKLHVILTELKDVEYRSCSDLLGAEALFVHLGEAHGHDD